jgi:hypothetical protein
METMRDLRAARGRGTECSTCGCFVPTSQPVLLLGDPATGEMLGFYRRACIGGAERLARERPGELDLTVVYMAGAAVRN